MGLVKPSKSRFADMTKRKGRLPMSVADGPLKHVPSDQLFKPYSPEAKAALTKVYTADQLRVVEAGEKAVSHKDLKSHGMVREDRYTLPYLDDLSRHNPFLDVKRKPDEELEGPVQFMNEDEQRDAIANWLERIRNGQLPTDEDVAPEQRPTRLDFDRFMFDDEAFIKGKTPKPTSFTIDGQQFVLDTIEKGRPNNSVLNHELPKMKDESAVYRKQGEEGDEDGVYEQLKKQTKMSLDEIRDLKVKSLIVHRVVNQTRLGKIQSMYVLAVAGNGKGLLGIGEGKSTEITEAQKQARLAAIRNMKPIPMYEHRTIYGDVYGKVSAVEVNLYSRPPGEFPLTPSLYKTNQISGFGLRVQHNIFEMARAAGLQDLSARVPRSRNKMNTVKATYAALMSQRIPDEIARGRGIKLVDVRKVYYAGRSPA